MQAVILSQFEAAMCTLHMAMADCPEREWSAPHPDAPFSQVAFHALLFTDIYLGWSEEAVREQAYHRANRQLFGDYEELEDRAPVNTYTRDALEGYFGFCLEKGKSAIPRESAEMLSGDSGFSYRSCSRLELHIYSIRHIQHHAAQLGLRNQLAGGAALRWVGMGWKAH